MLHTVNMFCKLDFHSYSALFRTLCVLCRRKHMKFYKEKDETYHCHLLKENGLLLILRRVNLNECVSYSALEIIMNPMRLLDGNDYYSLADIQHRRIIYSKFKQFFQPIKDHFERQKENRLLKFKLHLLDSYCFKEWILLSISFQSM